MSSAPVVKKDALGSDIPDPTNILLVRLESWRQTVNILSDYVDSLASIQKNKTHGLEKAKKSITDAPKFDYTPTSPTSPTAASAAPSLTADAASGVDAPAVGIAESFDNLRVQTDSLINKSIEVENQYKQAVLPQLLTLRGDIEKHLKGLKGPGLKYQKEVERARSITQKEVEALGLHVSSFGSGLTEKTESKNDPYVIKRNILSSLSDQVIKENSQADGIISIQNNFQTLERHVVQVLQQAVYIVNQTLSGFTAAEGEAFQAISDKFNEIQPDHEWNNFVSHNKEVLIPDNAEKRDVANLTFSNDEHPAAVPVIEGLLQRKTALLKQYSTGYFVLTPSNFLHQFKSQDVVQDPNPEFSLYLPACHLGAPSAQTSGKFKFIITGKERGKTLPISKKHSFVFKTNTYNEMIQWHTALSKAVGINNTDTAATAVPVEDELESPIESPATEVLPAAETLPAVGTLPAIEIPATVVTEPVATVTPAASTSAPIATVHVVSPDVEEVTKKTEAVVL